MVKGGIHEAGGRAESNNIQKFLIERILFNEKTGSEVQHIVKNCSGSGGYYKVLALRSDWNRLVNKSEAGGGIMPPPL